MQVVAPAGSAAALRAAVGAGADAVYLGLPRFGARAKAENFSPDILREHIGYAHAFGTKVFVTLNTLIKDGEMSAALDDAAFVYDCGADAAIVQDIRYIRELKRVLPELPLHASTQMGIHNREGALAVRDMGIRRAVLSRETLPGDIVAIKATGLEVEFFVQGALCVCFSGNCYFSSLASSYSGNRGKCMQLCRKPYKFRGKDGYFLSAKDICLYDKLTTLQELGVDAIKIEGRMRSEEYVAEAVRVYKSNPDPHDARETLKAVFNRGDYCSAYLEADAPFRVIYAKSQANIGRFIGKIETVRSRRVYVRGFSAHAADGFKIMRDGNEIAGATVRDGDICADHDCRPGDELRRTFDGALSERIAAQKRLLPVSIDVNVSAGKNTQVIASCDGATVCITGDVAELASTRAVTREDIMRTFNKVADFPFAPDINVKLNGDAFMPVSKLNELRRTAYDKLYGALIDANAPKRSVLPSYTLDFNKFKCSGTMLMIENAGQLTDEISALIDTVVLSPRNYADIVFPDTDKPILLNMPVTMRGADRDILVDAINRREVSGVVSNNYYTFKLTDKPVILGPGHNIIGKTDMSHITSYEADSPTGGYTYAYGNAPLMTLCHCPYGKCINCDGNDTLTDESGRRFALRKYTLAHCYWQLLNCVPHVVETTSKNKFYDCTMLSPGEILNVLRGEYSGAYTRGNMNKGLK